MPSLQLDKRLENVANGFPKCALGADLAADHGKLAARLLLSHRCERVIAGDISESSCLKMRRLMERLGLSDR